MTVDTINFLFRALTRNCREAESRGHISGACCTWLRESDSFSLSDRLVLIMSSAFCSNSGLSFWPESLRSGYKSVGNVESCKIPRVGLSSCRSGPLFFSFSPRMRQLWDISRLDMFLMSIRCLSVSWLINLYMSDLTSSILWDDSVPLGSFTSFATLRFTLFAWSSFWG